MRGLINMWLRGWKRTRVPESVWRIFQEEAPTQTTKDHLLTWVDTDFIVGWVKRHWESMGTPATREYLRHLRDDLNNNRGEVSLL